VRYFLSHAVVSPFYRQTHLEGYAEGQGGPLVSQNGKHFWNLTELHIQWASGWLNLMFCLHKNLPKNQELRSKAW